MGNGVALGQPKSATIVPAAVQPRLAMVVARARSMGLISSLRRFRKGQGP